MPPMSSSSSSPRAAVEIISRRSPGANGMRVSWGSAGAAPSGGAGASPGEEGGGVLLVGEVGGDAAGGIVEGDRGACLRDDRLVSTTAETAEADAHPVLR